MRVLLRDLVPGQNYVVQFRSKTATAVSEWSPLISFSTSSDILAPAAVTGLSVTAQGTAFLATWNPVTTNTDASAITDLKDYEVVVTSGVTSVTYFTTATRFDFSFEQNKAAFGTPSPNVTISVRARDLNLNAVGVATSASASNATPTAPTGFTAQAGVNNISFNWTKVSDLDLKYYRLYKGATAGTVTTLVYEGLANAYVLSTTNYSTAEFYKVAAVDVFGQETFASNTVTTAPLDINATDVTPPAAPSWAVSWFSSQTDLSNRNAIRSDVSLTWNANTEPDLAGYIVQYRVNGETVWSEVRTVGTNTTTTIRGLKYNSIYNFRLAAFDKSGNVSAFTNSPTNGTTAGDTTAPVAPSTPTVSNFLGLLKVSWNGLDNVGAAMASDTERVEVHVSTTNGFTPSTSTMKTYFSSAYSGKTQETIISGLPYDTVHYVKLLAVDFSGNASAASTQASGTPVRIATGAIEDLAVTNAKIASVEAGKIATGELAAGVRIIAGPELSTHAELTSTGLRVYADDPVDGVPNEVIRLGTDTGEFFAITDPTGEYKASIDDQGKFAGQAAEFAGIDSDGDGVKDSGVVIYGKDFADWDADKARGFVALGSYPTTTSFGPIVSEYGLFELSADLSIDRLYEIWAGPLVFSGSQVASALDMNIRYTTDGSSPTVTSTVLATTRWPINVADTSTPSSTGYIRIAGRLASGTYRFLLTVRRAVGTGTVYALTNPNNVFYFSISDMGRFAEPTLVLNTGGGTYSGGGGGGSAPTIKKTYVQTYAATWARTFKGDGSIRTDVGNNEMVQGYTSASGNQKAMIGGFLRAGGTIAPLTDITGSTISKMELYLYSNHWYYNAGGTAIFGTHGQTSLPATFSSSGSFVSPGWPKPGGRWVTLPSAWHAAFLTGGNRGITIGPGSTTSNEYYGRFNGPGKGGSTIPLLRITYVK